MDESNESKIRRRKANSRTFLASPTYRPCSSQTHPNTTIVSIDDSQDKFVDPEYVSLVTRETEIDPKSRSLIDVLTECIMLGSGLEYETAVTLATTWNRSDLSITGSHSMVCSTALITGFVINLYMAVNKKIKYESSPDQASFRLQWRHSYDDLVENVIHNLELQRALEFRISKLDKQVILQCLVDRGADAHTSITNSSFRAHISQICESIMTVLESELSPKPRKYSQETTSKESEQARQAFETIVNQHGRRHQTRCANHESEGPFTKTNSSDLWYDIWSFMISQIGEESNPRYFELIANLLWIVSRAFYVREASSPADFMFLNDGSSSINLCTFNNLITGRATSMLQLKLTIYLKKSTSKHLQTSRKHFTHSKSIFQ